MTVPYKLVLVTWVDSTSVAAAGRWVDTADLDNLQVGLCFSVGWLYRDTQDDVIVFSHYADPELGGEICIPKIAIKEIKEL